MAWQARRLAALFASAVTIAGAQDPFGEARRRNNDAAALYAEGRFDAAEPLYRAALALSAHDPLTAATIASNLGALYKRLNRFAEAEQMYTRALDLRRKRLPSLRPEIADSMNNLAEVYRLEGRYWEARNLIKAAVRALEQADPQSPDLPVFLNNWAGLERDLQHSDQAEQLLHEAWSRAEKSGEPANGSLAIVMNTLAQVLTDKHNYENAERFYRRAGAIFERAGPDDAGGPQGGRPANRAPRPGSCE
jgi:tetratricopeptide (TPR) repeat protein